MGLWENIRAIPGGTREERVTMLHQIFSQDMSIAKKFPWMQHDVISKTNRNSLFHEPLARNPPRHHPPALTYLANLIERQSMGPH